MNVSSVAASNYTAKIASGTGSVSSSAGKSGTLATTQSAASTETVSISQAAWEAISALSAGATSSADSQEAGSVEAKLAEIKGRDAVHRTDADMEYLRANDKRFAEIAAQGKSPEQLTSSELDYMQKAGGFVNTMANLSPEEKALYDKAVASGNTQAAAGLAQIAFIRTGGHAAGGSGGRTRGPRSTSATASSIRVVTQKPNFRP